MAAKFPQTFELAHREADLIFEALTQYAKFNIEHRQFSKEEIGILQKRFGEQLYLGSDR